MMFISEQFIVIFIGDFHYFIKNFIAEFTPSTPFFYSIWFLFLKAVNFVCVADMNLQDIKIYFVMYTLTGNIIVT